MENKLSYIIGIYTIRKPIFLCLKPSDIRRICDVAGYKLSESEEKVFMNPHDEICEDSTHPHTTLFTGDDLDTITKYDCIYRSLHIFDFINIDTSEEFDTVMSRHTHKYRENAIFECLLSFDNLDKGVILISSFISPPPKNDQSCVKCILNSYKLTSIEFVTARRKKSNYETTQFSLPCILSTEKEWYYDMLDIEFRDVTLSISITNTMIDMLEISIRLRSDPESVCFTDTYTTERTRAVSEPRSQEIT